MAQDIPSEIGLAGSGLEPADPRLDQGPATARSTPRPGTLRESIEQLELEAIGEALERFKGNRSRVAEALGLSRLGLRQKMRRLGLDDGPQPATFLPVRAATW